MLLCLNENHWHAYHSDSKKLDFSSELFFCWYGKSGSFLSTLLFVVLPKKGKGGKKKKSDGSWERKLLQDKLVISYSLSFGN